MRNKYWNSLLLSAASLALGACATPLPGLSMTDIPAMWEQKPVAQAPIWPAADWWQGFSSSELDRLIASAQTDNLDLAAAEARVLQADAQARAAGASLLPNIGLSAGADRRFARSSSGDQSHGDSFSATLGANYELDFWGVNRDAVAAARAGAKASEADRATVALTVTAGTADAYFQLLSTRDRLAIARMNLENAESVYKITESRVRNGVASPLEQAQQLGTLAGQRAGIPRLEQQELESRAALALLLGRPPEGFDVAGQNLEGIAAPAVQPGLTSELLARRPDVVAAEQNLRAANANLAAARAAFFPTISLTASGGVQSAALNTLLNGAGVAGIGIGLTQTIFDAGRLAAQSDAAQAREQEVLANYRSAVISAFSDVETALGNVTHLTQQEALQAEQVTQLQRAFDIANARYREGVDNYLTVLDAQRSLYSARDSYGQIKLQRLQGVLALYRALGGGWRDSDVTPSAIAAVN